MSDPVPLQTPGGFAPVVALGIDDGSGNLALVNRLSPLPIRPAPPPGATALEGTTSTSILAGPFLPEPLAPIFCMLSGDFTGSVRVIRSTDGGATLHPLTAGGAEWGRFEGPACEVVWEESEAGASLWLDCALTSGDLTYRLAQ